MELSCPHCSQRNRVPADRLADGPTCGRCHRSLLDAPLAAGASLLAELVGQQRLPVLVDFWAPWCGPCVGFAPTFAAAAGRYAGQVVFVKVDTEAEPELAQHFRIRSIPTLAWFVGGREAGRLSGALPPAELERLIRQVLDAGAGKPAG
ncbi:MAG: thioredoxin TrxC [Burkholderiaceae bacterium]|mgnify:CR=1 FL=1|nr:thioredoxin TrxC [Burkholderiaceae bacterium]